MSFPLRTSRIEWSFAWPWLLGFGLTVYLGLNGGGFDILVSGQVGVVVWWVGLLAIAVGAAPIRRPGPLALAALALFAALTGWVALSLTWTESTEKTAIDLAELATVLGAFALALLTRGRGGARQMIAATAAGIAVIGVVALLSRLFPDLFSGSAETGRLLSSGRERLSYPLDYWNGLAALIAVGIPLLLQIAVEGGHRVSRALAAAVLPALFLALYMTLSRNGIAGALIAIAAYLAFASNRLPKLLTFLITGVGGGVLILLSDHRYELIHGLGEATARSQGEEIFWITLAICAIAGLAQLGLDLVRRPAWAQVSRRQSQIVAAVAVVAALVALIAVDAPHHLSHAWHDFKQPSQKSERGSSRLTSVGGEDRYQLWSSALREFDDEPLHGTGANTFQLWWTRDGSVSAAIIDTHNLYLQTLGELGIVGLLLLLAFILTTLIGGGLVMLRAGPGRRDWLAAALAGSTVLWSTSVFDWMWKIPVIPIVTLLLVAIVVTSLDHGRDEEGSRAPRPFGIPLRVACAALSLAAVVAIAIPLTGAQLLRQSQNDARSGDVTAALKAARSAQNVQPGAASPRIQEALLYEGEAELGPAEAAALAGTEREPTNWRAWLVLSRIQAQNGRPEAALTSYREARSLNPRSGVFVRR